MTNECGDTESVPTAPRRFGQLPDLVVPDDFDEPLPPTESAVWETPGLAAQGGHTAPITVTASDLRRFADAYRDLGDASVMDRAWESDEGIPRSDDG